jgi:hypothetical protein
MVLSQARVAGINDGVTCLSLRAVECCLDRPVARARIEALELDRYTVHACIGCAPGDSEAFGYRNYRWTWLGEAFGDAAFRCREVLTAWCAIRVGTFWPGELALLGLPPGGTVGDQPGDREICFVEVLSPSKIALEGPPLLVLGVGVLDADPFR